MFLQFLIIINIARKMKQIMILFHTHNVLRGIKMLPSREITVLTQKFSISLQVILRKKSKKYARNESTKYQLVLFFAILTGENISSS